MSSSSDRPIVQELKAQAQLWIGIIGLLWGIQLINFALFNNGLVRYGIYPRQIEGLLGILWAPLLHGGFNHLMANTLPLLTLGWLVMLQRVSNFLIVTIISAFVSGLGTWLVGSPTSIHVGASGVIFGYFGYLLLQGYFKRSTGSIILSLLIILLYGGLIWGILPNQPGISWEGHLFGFIGGGVAARLLSRSANPS